MQLLNLTLDLPAANVALDEALLDQGETEERPIETLRLWEPSSPMVVIGRSSKPEAEVRLDFCREHQIPILRRASGGAAIVTGPGCLMYALVLSIEQRPALRSVDGAHSLVLETMARAVNTLLPGVHRQGISDLAMCVAESSPVSADRTLAPKKFSGNSLRLKRRLVLYHGTLLYDFPLALIADCLATAPRQPTYRADRDHRDFVTNLPVTADALRCAVTTAWEAQTPRTIWPQSRVEHLLTTKYDQPEWTIEV